LTAAFSAGAIVGPLVTQGLESVMSPFVTCALLMLITVAVLSWLLSSKATPTTLSRLPR